MEIANLNSAKVTRIIEGNGAEALRDAIASGIFDADVERMARDTIRENDLLTAKLREAESKRKRAERECRKYRDMYMSEMRLRRTLTKSMTDGFRAAVDADSSLIRHRAWRITGMILAGCVGAVAMMLAVTVAVLR